MFKPMLAAAADLDKVRFPLLVSAKLDGVRATVINGVVYSRKMLPIPNLNVQRMYGGLEGWDGELIVGSPTDSDCYRKTVSMVMTKSGGDAVNFWGFDSIVVPSLTYHNRLHALRATTLVDGADLLPQIKVHTLADLEDLEQELVGEGYEGIILRDPLSPYKFGRSTVNEQYLLKLKRFTDEEFEVIGYEERMHNGNEATIGALGQTKRSSHQANKSGRGDLGAITLRHPLGTFNCGSGFSDADRKYYWDIRQALIGMRAKIKFFQVGMKDFPRHPVFLGFRNGD